jgi:hypothetical protein
MATEAYFTATPLNPLETALILKQIGVKTSTLSCTNQEL